MNDTQRAIANTESILMVAAGLDPAAWATPLPKHMEARRNRSYKAAVEEFKAWTALTRATGDRG